MDRPSMTKEEIQLWKQIIECEKELEKELEKYLEKVKRDRHKRQHLIINVFFIMGVLLGAFAIISMLMEYFP